MLANRRLGFSVVFTGAANGAEVSGRGFGTASCVMSSSRDKANAVGGGAVWSRDSRFRRGRHAVVRQVWLTADFQEAGERRFQRHARPCAAQGRAFTP